MRGWNAVEPTNPSLRDRLQGDDIWGILFSSSPFEANSSNLLVMEVRTGDSKRASLEAGIPGLRTQGNPPDEQEKDTRPRKMGRQELMHAQQVTPGTPRNEESTL